MKLAALCCTFHRPHTLGHLIESFLRQDYPVDKRQLIILDDAGQYTSQEGNGWRLISIPRRFHSLGEKRNACAAPASADVGEGNGDWHTYYGKLGGQGKLRMRSIQPCAWGLFLFLGQR